jgi:hypothetical protein
LIPLQLHVKVLVPVTKFATLPVMHAAVPLGAVLRGVVLLALPQAPGTICGAEQLAVLPLFGPAQVQFQVLLLVLFVTPLGVPVVQIGVGEVEEAATVPQTPAIGCAPKLAATVWRAVIATVQTPVPLQSPPQPEKLWVASGVAVSVTVVPVV